MKFIILSIFAIIPFLLIAQNNGDAIIGKWMAYPKKNLIIEVYKYGSEYRGKIVWFNDNDDKTKPMNTRLDEKNLDPSLRTRKVLGLEVLDNMVYNEKSKRWEKGKIYDAKSGRIWSSSAWMTNESNLEVRGFWHFEFIGMSMSFKKVS